MNILSKKIAINLFMVLFLAIILSVSTVNAAEQIKDYKKSYNSVLNQYVADNGLVDYKGLKKDRQGLDKYLEAIEKIERQKYESWSEKEKIAFWINNYNALTLQLMLDKYPQKSIRNLFMPWDFYKFEVMGKKYSLNDIEHKILRKEFNEPRIHFAVNCASIGCPNLRQEVYTGNKLDLQLEEQAKIFLNSPKGLIVDKNNKVVRISSIFKWFGEDFTKNNQSVVGFIQKYVSENIKGYKVEYLEYDWSLNEQKRIN